MCSGDTERTNGDCDLSGWISNKDGASRTLVSLFTDLLVSTELRTLWVYITHFMKEGMGTL